MVGRALRELTPLASGSHRLGAELRHWRLTRELSQNQLGDLIHHSGALVSKVEKADRRPSLKFCRLVDEKLETKGALSLLWHATAPTSDETASDCDTEAVTEVVTTDDIVEAGLRWSEDVAGAVDVTCRMWRSEMDRRILLASTAWASTAFVGPFRTWLNAQPDVIPARHVGRSIGQADVDALWTMSVSFADANNQFGGSHARSTLIHYLDLVVRPLLLHGDYTERVGRGVMAAAARFCDICAYMSFDSGEHGLAQRYFVQALRLAHASGNRALAARILGDMSRQAHHLGDANQALELAVAGYATALHGGSPATVARCAILQGRAHALRGDAAAAAKSRLLAEEALDVEVSEAEPVWIQSFTASALTAQTQYLAADLGQYREVQRIAPTVIENSGGMQRRRLRSKVMLAHSYLPGLGADADVDHACELLASVLLSLPSLQSASVHNQVNEVRRGLMPYRDQPSVRQFESLYNHTVVASIGRSS